VNGEQLEATPIEGDPGTCKRARKRQASPEVASASEAERSSTLSIIAEEDETL
jgi:hypothetical protein